MKSIIKLKDDARKHEQKEEWEKAIQVYLQVLQISEEGEAEVELPLYNRIGDLAVRLGRSKDAMRYYEQAADRYAEAGLYNNAIALCNKALRYGPDRLELMKKLGLFSASQGFITDARRYFLEYAERKFAAGEVDEALTALEDFASVSDDADVRELLGRRLLAHGRSEAAVAELQRAYALRQHAGETERAEALRSEILAIDAAAVVDADAPRPAPSFDAAPAVEHDELPGLAEIDTGSFDIAPGTLDGLETTAAAPVEEDALDFGAIEMTGFETGAGIADAPVGGSSVGGVEGFESTMLDFGAIEADAVEDLGLEHDEASFELPTLADDADDAAAYELPTLDDEEDSFALPTLDDEEDSFALPTLDDEEDSYALPTLDDAADDDMAFALPTLGDEEDEEDEDTVSYELPTLDEDEDEDETVAFELPSLAEDEDEAAAYALPMLDEPDAEADATELPSLDDADDPMAFDLPTLLEEDEEEEEEDDEGVVQELPTLDEPETVSPFGLAGAAGDDTQDEEADVFDAGAPPLDVAADEAEQAEDEARSASPIAFSSFDEGIDAALTSFEEPEEETDDFDLAAPDAGAGAGIAAAEPADWTPETSLPAAAPKAPAAQPPAPPRAPPADDGFIDLGELLAEEEEETTRFRVQETAPTGDEDRDFAELLSQFKAKVSEHLPAEDAAAHYDLGLAFKEMGLIDEAIGEFQIALRAGHMRLKVYEELGLCFLNKEQFNIAEKVLRRALEMKYDDEIELLGVYYHLGRAYEGMGRRDQARDAYERVLGLDINFQDVTERLARL
ncbi:MAG TPA: tetratricopeptide repeat protein [Longimicrobiales bacterium]|nr:tetratricopeptide repeat protein [Longimicrobiales bacterium]